MVRLVLWRPMGALIVPMGTRRRAPDKGKITAFEFSLAAMIGELLGERAMGLIGLRHDEKAARVLVKAMHDAGTRHATDA